MKNAHLCTGPAPLGRRDRAAACDERTPQQTHPTPFYLLLFYFLKTIFSHHLFGGRDLMRQYTTRDNLHVIRDASSPHLITTRSTGRDVAAPSAVATPRPPATHSSAPPSSFAGFFVHSSPGVAGMTCSDDGEGWHAENNNGGEAKDIGGAPPPAPPPAAPAALLRGGVDITAVTLLAVISVVCASLVHLAVVCCVGCPPQTFFGKRCKVFWTSPRRASRNSLSNFSGDDERETDKNFILYKFYVCPLTS